MHIGALDTNTHRRNYRRAQRVMKLLLKAEERERELKFRHAYAPEKKRFINALEGATATVAELRLALGSIDDAAIAIARYEMASIDRHYGEV